jgi:hypothetical protein
VYQRSIEVVFAGRLLCCGVIHEKLCEVKARFTSSVCRRKSLMGRQCNLPCLIQAQEKNGSLKITAGSSVFNASVMMAVRMVDGVERESEVSDFWQFFHLGL